MWLGFAQHPAGMGECCWTLPHPHIRRRALGAGGTFSSACCSIHLCNEDSGRNRLVCTFWRIQVHLWAQGVHLGQPCERGSTRHAARPCDTPPFLRTRCAGWVQLEPPLRLLIPISGQQSCWQRCRPGRTARNEKGARLASVEWVLSYDLVIHNFRGHPQKTWCARLQLRKWFSTRGVASQA